MPFSDYLHNFGFASPEDAVIQLEQLGYDQEEIEHIMLIYEQNFQQETHEKLPPYPEELD